MFDGEKKYEQNLENVVEKVGLRGLWEKFYNAEICSQIGSILWIQRAKKHWFNPKNQIGTYVYIISLKMPFPLVHDASFFTFKPKIGWLIAPKSTFIERARETSLRK